jgi:hypothetical protein
MNVIGVLIGVVVIVYLVNRIYQNPGKVVFTESDNTTEATLENANENLIATLGLTKGDALAFQESAKSGEVFVKALNKAGAYETIGYLTDVELYKKVQQKRARGKVASAEGTAVTVSYSFS